MFIFFKKSKIDISLKGEELYQKYLNQCQIELAEQESKDKGIITSVRVMIFQGIIDRQFFLELNPMTWTSELKILADKIFGNQGMI